MHVRWEVCSWDPLFWLCSKKVVGEEGSANREREEKKKEKNKGRSCLKNLRPPAVTWCRQSGTTTVGRYSTASSADVRSKNLPPSLVPLSHMMHIEEHGAPPKVVFPCRNYGLEYLLSYVCHRPACSEYEQPSNLLATNSICLDHEFRCCKTFIQSRMNPVDDV